MQRGLAVPNRVLRYCRQNYLLAVELGAIDCGGGPVARNPLVVIGLRRVREIAQLQLIPVGQLIAIVMVLPWRDVDVLAAVIQGLAVNRIILSNFLVKAAVIHFASASVARRGNSGLLNGPIYTKNL